MAITAKLSGCLGINSGALYRNLQGFVQLIMNYFFRFLKQWFAAFLPLLVDAVIAGVKKSVVDCAFLYCFMSLENKILLNMISNNVKKSVICYIVGKIFNWI